MKTFKIVEHNMPKLEELVKKLQNKAKKIGNGNVNYNIVNETFETVDKMIFKFFTIELTGIETPIINGWEFVATIDHTSLKNTNIINKISTFEGNVPTKYHTANQHCDHCNSDRYRKDTYILFNAENNEYKQVGKSCLRDFLGHKDIEAYASYLELIGEKIWSNEEDWCYIGSARPKHITVKEWLEMTKEIVNKYGYVSKQKSEEFLIPSTTNEVENQIFGSQQLKDELERKGQLITDITQKTKDYVVDLINYIKNIDPKNDYESNIKAIANDDVMSLRIRGYATSMVSYYDKVIGEQKLAKNAPVSQFVGNVGDKIQLNLTVIKRIVWETMFGIQKLFIMTDDNGNIFTWKTSTGNMAEDEKITLKGTIKAHTEYNNNQQTTLTRCKIETL